jgi:hypothetical protein
MVVLPLRDAADAEVTWRALAPGLVRPVQIEAIQVERSGTLEFLAADRLHHECVSVGRAVPEELLKTLQHQGIIRRYYKATAGRSQSSMQ